MTISFTLAQLEQFRRDAKRLARANSISLHQALDRIAAAQGFKNWSLLAKRVAANPAVQASPATGPRHYLHGDQDEGDTSKYYCAECDLFVEAPHFSSSHGPETLERYLDSLMRWARRPAGSKSSRRRPDGAVNVLEAAVRANVSGRKSQPNDAKHGAWVQRSSSVLIRGFVTSPWLPVGTRLRCFWMDGNKTNLLGNAAPFFDLETALELVRRYPTELAFRAKDQVILSKGDFDDSTTMSGSCLPIACRCNGSDVVVYGLWSRRSWTVADEPGEQPALHEKAAPRSSEGRQAERG
jgi:hypothetical protein